MTPAILLHDSLLALSPQAIAGVLILHKAVELGQAHVGLTPETIATMSGAAILEHVEDLRGQTDAFNECRYDRAVRAQGVEPRIDPSWERHFDVYVRAIPLSNDKALAFNMVVGGGKFGSGESYPWDKECWLVNITGTETIIKHTFGEIA